MKKNKKQNIIFAAIAIIIISTVIGYNYSIEQTKQKGLKFGNELQDIQEDVKQNQIEFNSKITQWQEGDLTKEMLQEYSESHFQELEEIIQMYDELVPPEVFSASVELFKLSTQSQLESDKEYIEWIKNEQESNRVRSDSLLQESFSYEMMALGEFNAAKTGVKNYDDVAEKFEAPETDFTEKVNKIWQNMKENCHAEHASIQDNTNQAELEACLSSADKWKEDHNSN